MEALSGPVWAAAFWRWLSGLEEARARELPSYGLVGCMAAVLGCTFCVPYGRFLSALLGGSASARLTLVVQEAPSFLLPLLLVLCSNGAQLHWWPNRILLALFLTHYAYRMPNQILLDSIVRYWPPFEGAKQPHATL